MQNVYVHCTRNRYIGTHSFPSHRPVVPVDVPTTDTLYEILLLLRLLLLLLLFPIRYFFFFEEDTDIAIHSPHNNIRVSTTGQWDDFPRTREPFCPRYTLMMTLSRAGHDPYFFGHSAAGTPFFQDTVARSCDRHEHNRYYIPGLVVLLFVMIFFLLLFPHPPSTYASQLVYSR